MSIINFEVRQDGYTSWVRYASVELDTEDFSDIDEMREEAYQLVVDGEVECGEEDYVDNGEVNDTEISEDDYSEDADDYEWDTENPTVKPPEESSIEW